MKINESDVNYGRQAYVQGLESPNAPESNSAKAAAPKQTAPEDKVSLSGNARDLQVAQEGISLAPDVRTDRVQEVQSAVQQGTYKVDAQQVAEKIIGFSIDQMI